MQALWKESDGVWEAKKEAFVLKRAVELKVFSGILMRKKEFYRIQAGSFKDYASKFRIEHRGDLLSLFIIWAESKDFSEKDKLIIWKLVKD